MATLPTTEIDPITGQPKATAAGTNVTTNSVLTPATSGLVAQPATTTQQNGGLLPLMQDPNQQVQLLSGADTNAGNQAVLAKAQQQVLTQPQSQLMPQVVQSTSSLLNDPLQGLNANTYKQAQMDAFNDARTKSIEAARQKMADTANTGTTGRNMLDLMLQSDVDRSTLGSQIDYDLAQKKQDALIKALAEGRSTAGLEQNMFSQGLQNLANVRSMAEGERAQTTQQAFDLEKMSAQFGNDMARLMQEQDFAGAQAQLNREAEAAAQSNDINAVAANLQKQLDYNKWAQENGQTFTAEQNALNRALESSLKTQDLESQKTLLQLKAQIDSDTLMKTQDFAATQADLDRVLQEKLQSGDIAGQLEIMKQKAALEEVANAKQREWESSERVATQSWQTGERIESQDYDQAMKYFEAAEARALQSNDIDAQKYLADQRAKLDLQMQTNDMSQQEKMAYLTAQLEEAKANNDVTREKEILGFQATQTLNQMAAQYGYDEAKIKLQGDIQTALQSGEFDHAEAMQQAQLDFDYKQLAQQKDLSMAEIQLKARGLDMQQVEQTYNQIFNEIESGRADASAATEYLTGLGVKLPAADPLAQQKAMKAEYDATAYQWLQSHPEFANTDRNSDDMFTAEGKQKFLEYYNSTLYGEERQATFAQMLDGEISDAALRGMDVGDAEYDRMVSEAPALSLQNELSGKGLFNGPRTWTFKNVPDVGSYVNLNGRLYKINSGISTVKRAGKDDYQKFTVLDVGTGEIKEIHADTNNFA